MGLREKRQPTLPHRTCFALLATVLDSLEFALRVRRRCSCGGRRPEFFRPAGLLLQLLEFGFVYRFLKTLNRLAQSFAQLRQLPGPEYDQDDHENQQQLHPSETKHKKYPFRNHSYMNPRANPLRGVHFRA